MTTLQKEDAKNLISNNSNELGISLESVKIFAGYRTQDYIEVVLSDEKNGLNPDFKYIIRIPYNVDIYVYEGLIKLYPNNSKSLIESKTGITNKSSKEDKLAFKKKCKRSW